jgi:G3E family GTPase
MDLHLVGGFLGSGKTTAIINASRILIDRGLKVGVVTNDQGRYLVDTAFFRLESLPAVEVTGGCFCCNYHDLNDRLLELVDTIQPDVIFAESVGSCADIVATVVKPLLKMGDPAIKLASYSVFVDSRLLLRYLDGVSMPFSEDVTYIFEKQLEEASLIILNKKDLLTDDEKKRLEDRVGERFPGQIHRFQNSLSQDGVRGWVNRLQEGSVSLTQPALDIDYQRYAQGEKQMAWLDQSFELRTPAGRQREVLIAWMDALVGMLVSQKMAIGHLKFVIQSGDMKEKISFTSMEESGWQESIPRIPEPELKVLVNVRVESSASQLRDMMAQALDVIREEDVTIDESEADVFHPGEPKPTYRLS